MAYSPISAVPIQYSKADGTPANGYYLKFYLANSSTPISMQTDASGATSIAKAKLNESGYTISNPNDENTVFIPHLSTTYSAYRFVLYASAADADANNVTSGLPNIQSVAINQADDLRADLAASSGSSLIGYTQSGTGSVSLTVQDVLRESFSVKRFGAVGNGTTDDTDAIQDAINASLVASVGYKMVWFPAGIYKISRPLLLPANYRLEGDGATIKAAAVFTGETRNNIGSGGTTTLNCLLLFLLNDYNDISGPQRDNAYIGSGLTLDCNDVINCGIYIERMPYSTIACKVINTTAGGNAVDIGPYCWGTHLNGITVEDFAENAVSLGAGCNGVLISAPRIWGKSKTGVSGVLVKANANVNGVAVVGGFIEKLGYGAYIGRGNGPITFDGVDFEVCATNCVGVYGNPADSFKATVTVKNCYLDATGSKVYATSGMVSVESCRLRSGNDFETAAPGGFISASNCQYETGLPTIVANSNVAIDIEQSWTPVLLDDTLSNAEGQTYSIQAGTFNRVGNKIFFRGRIQLTSIGTLNTAQAARIGGLPFTSSGSSNTHSSVTVGFASGMAIATASAISGYVGLSSTYFNLQKFSAVTGTANLTIAEFSATGDIIFSGSYIL